MRDSNVDSRGYDLAGVQPWCREPAVCMRCIDRPAPSRRSIIGDILENVRGKLKRGVIATWSYVNTCPANGFWFSLRERLTRFNFWALSKVATAPLRVICFPILQPIAPISRPAIKYRRTHGLRARSPAQRNAHVCMYNRLPCARPLDSRDRLHATYREACCVISGRGFKPICDRKGLIYFVVAREIRRRRVLRYYLRSACTSNLSCDFKTTACTRSAWILHKIIY